MSWPDPALGDRPRAAGALVGVWEQQASWITGAHLYRPAGMVVVATGLGSGLDTVIVDGAGPADAVGTLAVADTLLLAHGSPLWLDLVAGVHPAVEAAARQRGMRPRITRHLMTTDTAGQGQGARPDIPAPISRARRGDAAAVQLLYTRGFGMPRRCSRRLGAMASLLRPDVMRLVWRRHGEAVAMATAHLVGDTVGVFGVATLPAYRRQGIAGELTRAAVAIGASRGAKLAWLIADPGATTIYERVGFEVIGEQQAWSAPS